MAHLTCDTAAAAVVIEHNYMRVDGVRLFTGLASIANAAAWFSARMLSVRVSLYIQRW